MTEPCDCGQPVQVSLVLAPQRARRKGHYCCWPCAETLLDDWLLSDLYSDYDTVTLHRLPVIQPSVTPPSQV